MSRSEIDAINEALFSNSLRLGESGLPDQPSPWDGPGAHGRGYIDDEGAWRPLRAVPERDHLPTLHPAADHQAHPRSFRHLARAFAYPALLPQVSRALGLISGRWRCDQPNQQTLPRPEPSEHDQELLRYNAADREPGTLYEQGLQDLEAAQPWTDESEGPPWEPIIHYGTAFYDDDGTLQDIGILQDIEFDRHEYPVRQYAQEVARACNYVAQACDYWFSVLGETNPNLRITAPDDHTILVEDGSRPEPETHPMEDVPGGD